MALENDTPASIRTIAINLAAQLKPAMDDLFDLATQIETYITSGKVPE